MLVVNDSTEHEFTAVPSIYENSVPELKRHLISELHTLVEQIILKVTGCSITEFSSSI